MSLLEPFGDHTPRPGLHTVDDLAGCNLGRVEATGGVRGDGKLVLRVEAGPQDRSNWLSMNDRKHWAVSARITKQWRLAGRATGLRHNVRALGWQRVEVWAYLHFADNLSRDAANYHPTVKAAVDGLVADAGLCPNDNAAHLRGPFVEIGEPTGRTRPGAPKRAAVTFVITDLGPAITRSAAA